MKTCRICGYTGLFKDFHKHKQHLDGYENLCKKCQSKRVGCSRKKFASRVREYNKKYRKNNPEKVKKWREGIALENKILWGARERAKKRNLPCTITLADIDIPEFCPVLLIKLEKSKVSYGTDNSPSLDCINPSLGYVPGNVAVISYRANTIKNNATAEELDKVSAWLKSHTLPGV